LLMIREMVKDLENLQGDFATNYQTIPVVYGERTSKIAISTLALLTLIPIYILIEMYDVGYMAVYFYLCIVSLIFLIVQLWQSISKAQYLLLHNILKLLIVAGVFSIILIDPSVLVNGRNLLPV